MTFAKNKLALAIAAGALSAAVIAPAHAASRSEEAAARKTEALEMKLEQMQEAMAAMQAELGRVKKQSTDATAASAKVQELDQWMASVKSAPEAVASKDNLIAVRGGFSNLDHARGYGADLSATDLTNGALLSNNNSNQGFYFGGAFDYNVNNDLFGLMDHTSFAVELGVEYAQYGKGTNQFVTYVDHAVAGTDLSATAANGNKALDSRLRLSISPKIKFMHDSKLRPWIIPVGAEINILGVPSNAVSVLNSGMQFGAGADYEIFRGIVVGADTRYHYSTSKLDGTPTDGFTTGGYVGFKF